MCVTWHLINSNVAKSVASAEVYTLSLRFNGHFPGEPGLAGVY